MGRRVRPAKGDSHFNKVSVEVQSEAEPSSAESMDGDPPKPLAKAEREKPFFSFGKGMIPYRAAEV
jgi:hypothetical protein